MDILLVASAFNSPTRRGYAELPDRGHRVDVARAPHGTDVTAASLAVERHAAGDFTPRPQSVEAVPRTTEALPVGAATAQTLGLVDRLLPVRARSFTAETLRRSAGLSGSCAPARPPAPAPLAGSTR